MNAEGGAARVVAVDIARDFDKVSHPGVLYKFYRYCGYSILLEWLRAYLLGLRLTVVVGGQKSLPHGITAGVPQDSLLGPIQFLLYINDAENHLPQGVDLTASADDTAHFQCLKAMDNIDFSFPVL